MKPFTFMLIAGEASGDLLAAELVAALKAKVPEIQSRLTGDVQPLRTNLAPRFFGAGGPHMAAAGVELAFDLTEHSVTGISEVLKNYFKFRRLFNQLIRLAIDRQPDVIICVDFSGFNRRFAHAIKSYVRRRLDWFQPWNPKLVQYVSPQVWASRPGRAYQMAEDLDLLLTIFPFELAWYARRVPKLRVEFVGHPMVGRWAGTRSNASQTSFATGKVTQEVESVPTVLLLPGSRVDEVRRHLPVVARAFELMRKEIPSLRGRMVLPNDSLAGQIKSIGLGADWEIQAGGKSAQSVFGLEIQIGDLASALAQSDVAITKSGTITMECAMFDVPAVVFYRTSWPTYFIGKQLVSVPHIAMPNLLADQEIMPEFVQGAATPENIASAALVLLRDEARRQAVKIKLKEVVATLGGPGASARAATAIVRLLQ